MCQKHYNQFKKYGYCLDTNPRTRKDPNEIVEYEDYAEIILYNNQSEEIARALIDLDDVDKVRDIKWSLDGYGYAIGSTPKRQKIHRLIMDCTSNMEVDHINGNPLDNRKSNLRICNHQQNIMNIGMYKHNKSGHKGVSWFKTRNKWRAVITYDGKQIHLGYYDNLEEAVEARKQAEIEYFGKYRRDED